MLGAIIGDIVGSRFEFHNTDNYDFELFTKECSYTDDTICTVAVADAILNPNLNTGIDYQSSLLHWCRKYPHPMGSYGASFNRWIHSPEPQPYNSFGNGAAMRVSPVAFAHAYRNGEHRVMREAMDTARVTHNHNEGLIGAAVTALMIHAFLVYDEDIAMRKCNELIRFYYGDAWSEYLPSIGAFDETCQGCVPLAFAIICNSTSFENAIRNAVAYGGDTDTLGAIVGSIAEARFGLDEKLAHTAMQYLPDDMKFVINKFYQIWQQRRI